jgi:hypothetical protein
MMTQFYQLPEGLQGVLLVLGTISALGIGLFALAFAAMGANKLKGEVKGLLGKGDVLTLLDGLATAPLGPVRGFVDETTDPLIVLLAQLAKQDPASMVKQIDQAFVLLGKLQGFWPQVKDALGLTEISVVADLPPKPPEGEQVVVRKLEPGP